MTPHGTDSTYVNHGCRCEECKAAHAAYQRTAASSRKERLRANPALVVHGTTSTYTNWLCRCEPCRQAWSEYAATRGPRR